MNLKIWICWFESFNIKKRCIGGIDKHDYLKEILDLPKPNNLNLLESKDKYRQNLVDLFLKIIS